jgi:uncharacterized protein (TIGR02217 family)
MSDFHHIILPDFISIHLQGGPVFSNNIVRSISGREVRILEKEDSFQKYILKDCRLSMGEFDIFNSFFRNRSGSLYSFLMKDFSDYKLENQILSNYDEELGAYLVEKSYKDGILNSRRRIFFIEKTSFSSNIEPIKLDFDNGLFYTNNRPEEIQINCHFYVRVRFMSDKLDYSFKDDNSILVTNLELIEV